MMTVTPLPPIIVNKPTHHSGSPPTSFINPWPSYNNTTTPLSILRAKFARTKPPFIPVPPRDELVQVRTPTWGADQPEGLRATWIGHASFLVETAASANSSRGIRILCDPVFSERTSPVQFVGPKRYTPTPCTLEELPDVDVVVISHDHYDHLDYATIKSLHSRRGAAIHFVAGLGLKAWFVGLGIPAAQVHELDWWDAVSVAVPDVGSVKLVCTPSQHIGGRTPFDRGQTLWCSWAVLDEGAKQEKRLFFAGDTGYRSVPADGLSQEEEEKLPHCPAFAEIGEHLGPFDLALLPIGLCVPRHFMSSVHCNPWDSIHVHKDIRAKKSIGMHWGTVRGGLSQDYEDVKSPPKWWKEAAEQAGLAWGKEIGLLDVGETISV